ncbi:MAG TPA: PqqD family peptide modification chaperone [Longimicrobium sp.]|nr:PqqD family peptide modification chaperone [Longimicrobium sp.]
MTLDTLVAATADAMSSSVGSETVVLHFTAGMYYGLDEVGSRIWQLVQTRRSVREIRDAVMEEYDVDQARCEQAVFALLASMADHGLITTDDAAAS